MRGSRRTARALGPAVAAALLVASTAACDSGSGGEGADAGVRTLTPAPAESPPASPGPRTGRSFAASASAESERLRRIAVERLEGVRGEGNAVEDVSVTGLPAGPSAEVRSALVRVTNDTEEPAFYAVKVEFVDARDQVLDTVVVGVENVPPDDTVSVQANSREAAGVTTFPRVAQAERGPG
ncbi:hypothetical protein EES43_01090 [Streptomyces sp. ADI96-02]|uniref:hypothetical protein n=1 Tax=Streptomyces sp. ADI96-02 TaxID=1522760 RepID=UPI000F552698|nr:hypothetical protein [Streptomyces sp. ADI96-02]RPK68787.1 hypothetical protein EES43_01090 [Streptomyces sp. ADI96-02]